uniref:Uncharacterized protein MANES_01G030100 n=1 Tax=Rhizophora mucronata TaxID=61149 RepID=A0A2P2PPD0_RHIMU
MDSFSHNNKATKHHQPSSSELISSAKLVADAAKATLHHETEKVDKGRVAGAAANILEAASHYGKLEEKSFGKYVEKAEDYLHKYNVSHSPNDTSSSGHSATGPTTNSSSHSTAGNHHSESGYGEYLKMAQGILKKH